MARISRCQSVFGARLGRGRKRWKGACLRPPHQRCIIPRFTDGSGLNCGSGACGVRRLDVRGGLLSMRLLLEFCLCAQRFRFT